ncbi:uncharacterized protein LOC123989267 [Osmia bicornis bicornis]|uniref:uncharacterized protein LOC123989267 n=1 Tax=Osmia bicornis bicornis TaxID=1437191 RepID=UPI001EAEEE0A|nr:uncharacterized protein LOC123989267 [Osmia bicornis bicornis]
MSKKAREKWLETRVLQKVQLGSEFRRKDTNFRAAIPASIRLVVTLRYLATGDSFTSLIYTFKISKQLISKIVPEVCEALISTLKNFVKIPATEEEWEEISHGFNARWNFPHCIGAMDGKHVEIVAPENSGSLFYNYKRTFSVVLLVVIDSNYNIIYADVGCQGRISDGGVFHHAILSKKLEKKELALPRAVPLMGRTKPTPFVLVADDAFPLSTNLMKAFPGHHDKCSPERIYNYRLCRARRIVENVFGILSSKFRVFLKPIALSPKKVEIVTLTCIYLHNFLRRNSIARNYYSPPGTFDRDNLENDTILAGSWRAEMENRNNFIDLQHIARRAHNQAHEIRKEFMQYFMTPIGSVPWQNNYV